MVKYIEIKKLRTIIFIFHMTKMRLILWSQLRCYLCGSLINNKIIKKLIIFLFYIAILFLDKSVS